MIVISVCNAIELLCNLVKILQLLFILQEILTVRDSRHETSKVDKQDERNPRLQALVDLFKKEDEVEEGYIFLLLCLIMKRKKKCNKIAKAVV